MKRKFEEIIAELPTSETVKKIFKSLQPAERLPELRLPPNLDPQSPYSLFSLFISEEIFEKISKSTREEVVVYIRTSC
jgi:hypothetical protein